jgi:hypothetical protein
MKNFLEVYADPKAIRSLLESIQPIAFGQVDGRLWTTTGEIDKFAGKGAGQRVTKGLLGFAGDLNRIENPEAAAYLATQMGKQSTAFAATMSMWHFINAVSPEVALCAIVCNNDKTEAAARVREAVGLPGVGAVRLVEQLKDAIKSGKANSSWGYRVPELKPVPKSPIVGGELSGLLQVCFAEEAKAKGQYDKALAALEVAQVALAEAVENTKAIVRATEIAERLAK